MPLKGLPHHNFGGYAYTMLDSSGFSNYLYLSYVGAFGAEYVRFLHLDSELWLGVRTSNFGTWTRLHSATFDQRQNEVPSHASCTAAAFFLFGVLFLSLMRHVLVNMQMQVHARLAAEDRPCRLKFGRDSAT